MKNLISSIFALVIMPIALKANDSASHYFQKGLEEKNAGRFLVASKLFEQSIQFDPSNTEAYLQNGLTNLEMRKMNAALINLEKVNALDPANETAIKELSQLYFAFKKYDKAIAFAQKCKICTNSDRIIALSYYADENYGLAEKSLLTYLQKYPLDADASFALGRTYLELENERKAIEFYENAIKANPSRASWHGELGLIYYNANQFKKAIDCFNNAIKNGITQSNDFRENLAFAYIYANDATNAEPILQDLIQRKAGNKEILRDIAEAYYSGKQYDNSLRYCQQLMELDAKDAKALYQAGLCFQKKGEKDRGQKMCDIAIEMDPSLAKMRKQSSITAGL